MAGRFPFAGLAPSRASPLPHLECISTVGAGLPAMAASASRKTRGCLSIWRISEPRESPHNPLMNTFLAFYQNIGPALTLLVIGTFLLAGTVKGVIGLGLPTVAMGMLGLAMLPAQAAALLIIPSTVTNLWQLAFGGHLSTLLKRLWPLLLLIFLGTGLGTLWLGMGGGDWVVRALGAALLVYALSGLFLPTFSVKPATERWLAPLWVDHRHHHLGHRRLRDSCGAVPASAGLESRSVGAGAGVVVQRVDIGAGRRVGLARQPWRRRDQCLAVGAGAGLAGDVARAGVAPTDQCRAVQTGVF